MKSQLFEIFNSGVILTSTKFSQFLFQMAEVLFFVIDSKTRAISSMIEVAYLVGKIYFCLNNACSCAT